MVGPWPDKIAYTLDEAVFASSISRRSLQAAISDGRLKSTLSHGRRRILPADLRAFVLGPQKSFTRDAAE
jgi:hypothetical protein